MKRLLVTGAQEARPRPHLHNALTSSCAWSPSIALSTHLDNSGLKLDKAQNRRCLQPTILKWGASTYGALKKTLQNKCILHTKPEALLWRDLFRRDFAMLWFFSISPCMRKGWETVPSYDSASCEGSQGTSQRSYQESFGTEGSRRPSGWEEWEWEAMAGLGS